MSEDDQSHMHAHLVLSPFELRYLRRLLQDEYNRLRMIQERGTGTLSERAMLGVDIDELANLRDRVNKMFEEMA